MHLAPADEQPGFGLVSHPSTIDTPGSLQVLNDPSNVDAPAQQAQMKAEMADLRGEVERVRAERDRLRDRELQIMTLIGAAQPEHIIHDLRNVLNERSLLRALANMDSAGDAR